jgi:predicted transcriptional regulator
MEAEIKLDAQLWEQFVKVARKRRRNPISLLTDHIRDFLEIQEDRQLDEEIRAEAQKSGYHEEDAVEIVRQYRREKKQQRAAS